MRGTSDRDSAVGSVRRWGVADWSPTSDGALSPEDAAQLAELAANGSAADVRAAIERHKVVFERQRRLAYEALLDAESARLQSTSRADAMRMMRAEVTASRRSGSRGFADGSAQFAAARRISAGLIGPPPRQLIHQPPNSAPVLASGGAPLLSQMAFAPLMHPKPHQACGDGMVPSSFAHTLTFPNNLASAEHNQRFVSSTPGTASVIPTYAGSPISLRAHASGGNREFSGNYLVNTETRSAGGTTEGARLHNGRRCCCPRDLLGSCSERGRYTCIV